MLLEFWDLIIDLDRSNRCDDLDRIGVCGFD